MDFAIVTSAFTDITIIEFAFQPHRKGNYENNTCNGGRRICGEPYL